MAGVAVRAVLKTRKYTVPLPASDRAVPLSDGDRARLYERGQGAPRLPLVGTHGLLSAGDGRGNACFRHLSLLVQVSKLQVRIAVRDSARAPAGTFTCGTLELALVLVGTGC